MANLSTFVGKEQKESSYKLDQWRYDFIETAIKYNVFEFGSFILKSGRKSPYFFNIGNFIDGEGLFKLASAYAYKIHSSGIEFDVLFGPAYKGIPIVACTALILSEKYNKNYFYVYNRKEEKTHGEGGTLIGAVSQLKEGTKVLILDDVMTAGTAVKEAMKIIEEKTKCTVVGIFVCLDRQECLELQAENKATDISPGNEKNRISSLQEFEKRGIKVGSLIEISHIVLYLERLIEKGEQKYYDILNEIKKHREICGL